ncbi:uncharacterized protein LOC142099473 isoform X1 [Mixophyes fleayi]|uniref:uncharacterized protein LOC142099473 isoform X1 n=1 Tax=Mixophyes fleayi TaxID=3061075 RepID=UPI003F4DAEC6
MVSFILPPPGRFSVGHQSPFPPFGLQEPPPPPFFRGHGSQVSPLPLPLAGVPPPPPPVSSPLLFSMDAVVQSGVSFSSNKAPGLLGPPPGRFSPGGSGVACQQFPMEQSAAFRSQVPDPGETWRSQPRSINQNSWDSDPSWSLPYPPRGYGPVSGTGSRWTAPYPPLSGQHFHAYPEPSLGNIFGVTGTVPPFPPVSQQGGGDQRAPPQAGFLGHLTASTPVPAPAGVLPQPLCNLPSPNSNVFSRPVSQAQSSSLVVPAGMDRSPSRSQQGGEAECAAVQQESQPGGSRDEGGAGVVLQEAQGADDGSLGIRWLAEASLAPATRKCYQGAWERWLSYCASCNSDTSGQIPSITGFMWKCYNEGVSRAKMGSLLAGISFTAKLNNAQDPTKSFIITKALKGWSRIQPITSDTRRPIDGQILARLMAALRYLATDDYEALLFGLAFSMAYHGAFRVSELVARSKNDIGGALLFRNVILQTNVIRCKIVKSKTDQIGRGHWLAMTEQQGTSICPVKLANQFAKIRPPGEGLWLSHSDNTPVTKFQFSALLKRALGEVGLNPVEYGTHSFRIGAATAAAARGASVNEIQALGRWKSQAYKKYIRPDK